MGSVGGGGGTGGGSFLFRAELLLVATAVLAYTFSWARAWTVSGATVLSVLLVTSEVRSGEDDVAAASDGDSTNSKSNNNDSPRLLGRKRRNASLPVPLLVVLVNVACAASSTSWLFYWLFTVGCWAAVAVVSLSRFPRLADMARGRLRAVLRRLQFTADKVALFELPALELDVGGAVAGGLMVVRGVTLSLSSLTLEAHGVEVGIKLSDDMELAVQTDRVAVALFRRVDVADVYACLKGGQYEMTFGRLEPSSTDARGHALMDSDTPLLRAATTWSSGSSKALSKSGGPTHRKWWERKEDQRQQYEKIPMTDRMTNGRTPSPVTSAREAAKSVMPLIADDEHAARHYKHTMEKIAATSEINVARKNIHRLVAEETAAGNSTAGGGGAETHGVDLENEGQVRAAICSQLHDKASIQHPPRQSIKVSTLKELSRPAVRRFMHRLPMLLRLLLNQVAQFHPVNINSVTATASGSWVKSLLESAVFKSYAEQSSDIRRLRERIFAWLANANFALQLSNVAVSAQVPFFADDGDDGKGVQSRVLLDDIVAYRTSANGGSGNGGGRLGLVDVIRLSGADATFSIPACLLPHHEHLLPSRRVRHAEARRQQQRITALDKKQRTDSMGRVVQAKNLIERDRRDEINAHVAAHVRLPARFDQELLNFVAALVKATKIIEFEKGDDGGGDLHHHRHYSRGGGGGGDDDSSATEDEVHGFREFSRVFSNNMKDGVKRATVNAAANDRWIAKLIGKVTRKLQVMQGDVGYSGNIPISLKPYRDAAETESKILP